MTEKLEKFTDDVLNFDDKYAHYIISFSFIMVMLGCGLWQLKIYDISSIFSLIGVLIMIIMLFLSVLSFIIYLIVEGIKRLKEGE